MTTTDPFRINIVCSGNICRSPMGEVMLGTKLAAAGLTERVRVRSSGTGDWHIGEPADQRTVTALANAGYDGSAHRASWLGPEDLTVDDLFLVADRGHLRHLNRLIDQTGASADVRLLRSYDPVAVADDELEVDDPYYGDANDFARCLAEVERACEGIVEMLKAQPAAGLTLDR